EIGSRRTSLGDPRDLKTPSHKFGQSSYDLKTPHGFGQSTHDFKTPSHEFGSRRTTSRRPRTTSRRPRTSLSGPRAILRARSTILGYSCAQELTFIEGQ